MKIPALDMWLTNLDATALIATLHRSFRAISSPTGFQETPPSPQFLARGSHTL